MVAGLAAVPMFRTVADSVMTEVSVGLAGVQEIAETTRSGFGAGVPHTSSSATWPDGAPVFELKRNWTSAVVALTGIVTAFVPCVNW